MIPRSFDFDTCREMLGDERARAVEKQARDLADAGLPLPPVPPASGSYWGTVKEDMERIVMVTVHHKRTERNARKAERKST